MLSYVKSVSGFYLNGNNFQFDQNKFRQDQNLSFIIGYIFYGENNTYNQWNMADVFAHGAGHGGAAVLLPGFAIIW